MRDRGCSAAIRFWLFLMCWTAGAKGRPDDVLLFFIFYKGIKGGLSVKICHCCRKEITLEGKVGWREVCPFCRADHHCCLNCHFYDPGAYNQCREPQAERVLDKDRSNFCDWFAFRDAATGGRVEKEKQSARGKLDSLFKSL